MHDHFQQLISSYLTGNLTDRQRHELIAFLENEEASAHLADLIRQQLATGEFSIDADLANTEDRIVQGILKRIQSGSAVIPFHTEDIISGPAGIGSEPAGSIHRIPFFRKWGWAAAAILILGSGAYLLVNNRKHEPALSNHTPPLQNDIAPGGDKAMLTLSDGTTISLDSAANGAIARQGKVSVIKSANGQIVYDRRGTATGGAVADESAASEGAAGGVPAMMNTLRTPRGGQYRLTLPDGTGVWLNAASAITYPASFTGKERRVIISGEVYFEVAADKSRPFIADVDGRSSIEVLGTHFDVNSYKEEGPVKTTLLEGRVKVTPPAPPKGGVVILEPGQQAQTGRERSSVVDHANIDKVMAWKNGLFNFENSGLEEVMRQLERWYDVEVVYEKGVPDIRFEGEISRNIKLSDLLKVLARADVKFRIEEGRRLVVLP